MGLSKAYDELLDGPTLVGEASIYDDEGGFTGVQYNTDNETGELNLANSALTISDFVAASSGKNLELGWNGSEGIVQAWGRDGTGGQDLKIQGQNLELTTFGPYVDLSQSPANIRLATGQNIEDGSGTRRLSLLADQTVLRWETGGSAIQADESNYLRLRARSGTPVTIFDRKGSFTGVQYKTSSSAPGTLELTNANLVIPEGQNIEDTSGNARVEVLSIGTTVRDENGEAGLISLSTQGGGYLNKNGDGRVIRDSFGPAFDAVTYRTSSSSPGTLELTNAVLDAEPSLGGTYAGRGGTAIHVGAINDANSFRIVFTNTVDEYSTVEMTGGELVGEDNSGNRTTLT